MKKIRIIFVIAGATLVLAASGLRAQTPVSIQNITLSLVGEYQTNAYYVAGTNLGATNVPWTSELSQIRPILISTYNLRRALSYDLEGTNWPRLDGANLVREVNLTNGAEGIYFFRENPRTNVALSNFFSGSFSNNFTAGLSNAFPALTNDADGSTNIPVPQTLLYSGKPDPANNVRTSGLYFISLNTTNIKFNLLATGNGSVPDVAGHVDGTLYRSNIDSEILACAGTFYLNVATNIYGTGSNAPAFVTGPMHGTFITGPPYFSTFTPAEGGP